MAIELTKEKRAGAPLWMIFLSLGVGIVLVFLIVSYLFFYFAYKGTVKKIEDLDASMVGLNKNVGDKESELSLIQKKINDYNELVSNHNKLENVFSFLEKKTITSVWFDSFDFDVARGNAVILNGVAPNFIALGQQLDILKKEELIKEISVSEISINEDGEVVFALNIDFAPEIFSYDKEI